MRQFNEADKKKKQGRIQVPHNPANLSDEKLSQLEGMVKARLKGGHLPCGSAFKIAREAGVPRIAVGEMADSLGIRISDCQIGCFKVEKAAPKDSVPEDRGGRIFNSLRELAEREELSCPAMHALAADLKLPPMAVADVANYHKMKVGHCQLGCF